MARAIWTGSVSFGLVNVPVGLYSATQDHDVHFHQFEKGTSSRIRNKRVNEDTGDEVAYEDIVKGAEVDDGGYVMLTQEELESVEPGRSRTIDISDFVDASEIDPIYYQKSYYLAPSDDSAQEGVQAAGQGDGQGRTDRGRHVRDARQAVPRRHPARRGTCWCWRPCSSPTRCATRPRSSTSCRRGPRSAARTSTWR